MFEKTASIKNPEDTELKKVLIFLSVFYLISLALPAFPLGNSQSDDYMLGFQALLMALGFGWGAVMAGVLGALAGYANLFFYYILIRLYFRKENQQKIPVFASVIMVSLASLSFAYHEITGAGNITVGNRLIFWGYGTFVWLFSIYAIAFVVYCLTSNKKIPSISRMISVFLVILVISGGFQFYRYSIATEQEKSKFFKKETWLITSKLPTVMNK